MTRRLPQVGSRRRKVKSCRSCGTCAHARVELVCEMYVYACRKSRVDEQGRGAVGCPQYLQRLEWVPRDKGSDQAWVLRLGEIRMGAIGRWYLGEWWASYCHPRENYTTPRAAAEALLQVLSAKGIDQ